MNRYRAQLQKYLNPIKVESHIILLIRLKQDIEPEADED
jgi:hypothetical protein